MLNKLLNLSMEFIVQEKIIENQSSCIYLSLSHKPQHHAYITIVS